MSENISHNILQSLIKFLILHVLKSGDESGAELKKKIEALSAQFCANGPGLKISNSSFYLIVNNLEGPGDLIKRNGHALTISPKGEQQYEEWKSSLIIFIKFAEEIINEHQ
jgi:DNA-binding PadR family transcriptional regulator